MRDISVELKTHLASELTTLATCCRITRVDGISYYFTDHDADLEIGGNTYSATYGYDRSAIKSSSTMKVDNLDLTGFITSGGIREQDVRNKLLNFAQVELFIVNWADLSQGQLLLKTGNIGEINLTGKLVYIAEIRGLTQRLRKVITEKYQPECRAHLGDKRCKIPIRPPVIIRNTGYSEGDFVRVPLNTEVGEAAFSNRIYEVISQGVTSNIAPVYNTGIESLTTDGTVQLKAHIAWTNVAVVAEITDNKVFRIGSPDIRLDPNEVLDPINNMMEVEPINTGVEALNILPGLYILDAISRKIYRTDPDGAGTLSEFYTLPATVGVSFLGKAQLPDGSFQIYTSFSVGTAIITNINTPDEEIDELSGIRPSDITTKTVNGIVYVFGITNSNKGGISIYRRIGNRHFIAIRRIENTQVSLRDTRALTFIDNDDFIIIGKSAQVAPPQWEATITYELGDEVEEGNNYFVSLEDDNLNHEPNTFDGQAFWDTYTLSVSSVFSVFKLVTTNIFGNPVAIRIENLGRIPSEYTIIDSATYYNGKPYALGFDGTNWTLVEIDLANPLRSRKIVSMFSPSLGQGAGLTHVTLAEALKFSGDETQELEPNANIPEYYQNFPVGSSIDIVNEWYNGGLVHWETGLNSGRSMEIKTWNRSLGIITLFLEAERDLEVGDKMWLYPGCDKRRITCGYKFRMLGSINFHMGNIFNMRGEPDLPGRDLLQSYPNAK